MLLVLNQNPDSCPQTGFTPALIAAQFGHAAAVELLHSSGADLDKPNGWGATLAYVASWFDRVDVLAVLREKGADLTAADKQGKTPLDVALEKGHEAAAELLRASNP